MARFLADENISLEMVLGLRAAGLDVEWIQTLAPGASDEEILASAGQQQRILITYDTDFGDLIFNQGAPAQTGVLLLRLTGSTEAHTARLLEVLDTDDDWDLYFTSIGDERVRRRRLPETR